MAASNEQRRPGERVAFDKGHDAHMMAIDGTWPVRSERNTGLKGSVNALASSILLVCRRRDG